MTIDLAAIAALSCIPEGKRKVTNQNQHLYQFINDSDLFMFKYVLRSKTHAIKYLSSLESTNWIWETPIKTSEVALIGATPVDFQ